MNSDWTKDELKNYINNLIDIDFIYQDIRGSICPFSCDNIAVAYNGNFKDYKSIEDVLTDTEFWKGKTVLDICHEFEPI